MIITDEKILRQKCEDVKPEEIGELIELLERELSNSARLGNVGIGLAAPQINVHKNVAIVRVGDQKLNLINAKIVNQYDPAVFKNEGCLSLPGITEDTTRFQEIEVRDNLVFPHGIIATGLFSVVIQHELDHLNGIIFTDRAIPKVISSQPKKVRPNDPCICGLKIKYKRCHGK